MEDSDDTAGVSISRDELTAVGVASVAEGSIETTTVVGMTTAEDDESISLDWGSKDVVIGDDEVRPVGTLINGSTEDSMVVEVDSELPISLARLENISVAVGTPVSGMMVDSDVTEASVEGSRVVLMSSGAVEVV